jgi:hypothetical protein
VAGELRRASIPVGVLFAFSGGNESLSLADRFIQKLLQGVPIEAAPRIDKR